MGNSVCIHGFLRTMSIRQMDDDRDVSRVRVIQSDTHLHMTGALQNSVVTGIQAHSHKICKQWSSHSYATSDYMSAVCVRHSCLCLHSGVYTILLLSLTISV